MRAVFIGAGELTIGTARLLINRGHEVVIIEEDRNWIDELSEDLDCSFLHGDGSKPHILEEVGAERTDFLFCLTDNDQDNIIASLVGRSLGFKRVVTSIRDQDFEGICRELGLESTINPARTISRYLADMASGIDILELSTVIKGEARFFTFVAGKEEAGPSADLKLPDQAQVVCFYRDDVFHLAGPKDKLRSGDEVVILTHSDNLAELQERFQSEEAESGENEKE